VTIKRITFNDNIKSEIGRAYVYLNGASGEITIHVGKGELRIFTQWDSIESRVAALDALRDLHLAISELTSELNRQGVRT